MGDQRRSAAGEDTVNELGGGLSLVLGFLQHGEIEIPPPVLDGFQRALFHEAGEEGLHRADVPVTLIAEHVVHIAGGEAGLCPEHLHHFQFGCGNLRHAPPPLMTTSVVYM